MLAAHPGFSNSEGLDRVDHIEDLVITYLGLLGSGASGCCGSVAGWMVGGRTGHAESRARAPSDSGGRRGLYLPGFDQFEFFRDPISNPGFPAEMCRRCFHDPNSEIARSFIPDQILILWGESDGLLPLDFARAYQELIPGVGVKSDGEVRTHASYRAAPGVCQGGGGA